MKFLFLFSLVLFSSAAQARPVTFDSGVVTTINVTATVVEIIDEEFCLKNPDSDDCKGLLIINTEPPRHFCEDHPDGYGCKYYKPEAKQNE